MLLNDEVLYPRFLRSLVWIILLQYVFVNCCLLFFRIFSLSWHPLSSITGWLFCIVHWKSNICFIILSASIAAFGALNLHFSTVKKHISSTKFEKICRSLSPHCLQHVICTMVLGGLSTYCYDSLFHNFLKSSLMHSWLSSSNDFEQSFIIGHGCFTGVMFSLKYFICNLYLIKFGIDQEPKMLNMKSQKHEACELLKESFFCVIKAVHWYYLSFVIFGSPVKILTFSYFGNLQNEDESLLYSLINPKLFFMCVFSGVMVSFTWSVYLVLYNIFATKRHIFPIKIAIKGDKVLTLSSALASKESSYLQHLAVVDLRVLAQLDPLRRSELFAISHPGGHPHDWKAVSGVCIGLLQNYVIRLSDYSFATAATTDSKALPPRMSKAMFDRIALNGTVGKIEPSLYDQALSYLREKPAVSYFFEELPNVKLMKLFADSQPITWIIDAFGYLVSTSYTEDQYGVVQQTLPDIICLLLDIKMAEEKMPVGSVGIRTYVKDPHGRYEHSHQRLLLRNAANNSLFRIANTFGDDIDGINLPEMHRRYFQRYRCKKS